MTLATSSPLSFKVDLLVFVDFQSIVEIFRPKKKALLKSLEISLIILQFDLVVIEIVGH